MIEPIWHKIAEAVQTVNVTEVKEITVEDGGLRAKVSKPTDDHTLAVLVEVSVDPPTLIAP